MFTQLVMISTIFLLFWTGISFFKKSREKKYFFGKVLAFGFFFTAIGILCYSIRDIFVQFKIYSIQELLFKIGAFFHLLGVIITFWFFCKQFVSVRLSNIFLIGGLFVLLIGSIVIVGNMSFFSEEIINAPFEPIPYQVVRNYIDLENIGIAMIILFLTILLPVLLIIIILFNVFKLKDEQKRKKGMLYGLGFLLLFMPMIICLFISPIYARWGYLLGAILLYRAFNIRI